MAYRMKRFTRGAMNNELFETYASSFQGSLIVAVLPNSGSSTTGTALRKALADPGW